MAENRTTSTEIRIRVPHPSSTLANNVLGVLGLIGIVVAVTGLTGWLWALLAGSIFAVTLCLIGSTYAAPVEDVAEVAEDEPTAAPVAAVPRSA